LSQQVRARPVRGIEGITFGDGIGIERLTEVTSDLGEVLTGAESLGAAHQANEKFEGALSLVATVLGCTEFRRVDNGAHRPGDLVGGVPISEERVRAPSDECRRWAIGDEQLRDFRADVPGRVRVCSKLFD